MTKTRLFLALAAIAAAGLIVAPVATAEEGKVVSPFNGKSLEGWKLKGNESESQWKVGAAKLDPANPAKLVVVPADNEPAAMVNLVPPHSVDVYTDQKFGDAVIDLEIMVPKGSNSGVYVMGEYEIQVLDSYGREKVGPGDMGGIYGASAPLLNASKKPGEWQRMVIDYIAPKFEGDKKVANGKIVKVTLNGKVIHENVELKSQTPGGVTGKEAPEGPLMFQGNHGAVAYRNIKITPKK